RARGGARARRAAAVARPEIDGGFPPALTSLRADGPGARHPERIGNAAGGRCEVMWVLDGERDVSRHPRARPRRRAGENPRSIGERSEPELAPGNLIAGDADGGAPRARIRSRDSTAAQLVEEEKQVGDLLRADGDRRQQL